MFYWGNFFSNTLHLEGKYLENNRQRLYSDTPSLIKSNSYISMGKTPWHYHFEADNYLALSQGNSSKLLNDGFIKLSTKIELENWQKLPELSVEYLQKLLKIISD